MQNIIWIVQWTRDNPYDVELFDGLHLILGLCPRALATLLLFRSSLLLLRLVCRAVARPLPQGALVRLQNFGCLLGCRPFERDRWYLSLIESIFDQWLVVCFARWKLIALHILNRLCSALLRGLAQALRVRLRLRAHLALERQLLLTVRLRSRLQERPAGLLLGR